MSFDFRTHFDEQELEAVVRQAVTLPPGDLEPEALEIAGKSLNRQATEEGLSFGGDLWLALKQEIWVFLCTDDQKYRDLKKSIATQGKRSQTAVVSAIAVFVGATTGVEAGILVPYVGLALLLVARLSLEAFCRATRPA